MPIQFNSVYLVVLCSSCLIDGWWLMGVFFCATSTSGGTLGSRIKNPLPPHFMLILKFENTGTSPWMLNLRTWLWNPEMGLSEEMRFSEISNWLKSWEIKRRLMTTSQVGNTHCHFYNQFTPDLMCQVSGETNNYRHKLKLKMSDMRSSEKWAIIMSLS